MRIGKGKDEKEKGKPFHCVTRFRVDPFAKLSPGLEKWFGPKGLASL